MSPDLEGVCAASRQHIAQKCRPTAPENFDVWVCCSWRLPLTLFAIPAALCKRSSKMLGVYRHCCRFCARGDGTVKAVREKASLFHTCFPSKREVKHLSS